MGQESGACIDKAIISLKVSFCRNSNIAVEKYPKYLKNMSITTISIINIFIRSKVQYQPIYSMQVIIRLLSVLNLIKFLKPAVFFGFSLPEILFLTSFVMYFRLQYFIISTSCMEDFSKTYSTSGSRTRIASNWLSTSASKPNFKHATVDNCSSSPTNIQSQSNYSQYSKLNSLALTLMSQLEQLRQQNKSCLSSIQCEHENLQNIQSYTSLLNQNIEIQKQLKGRINKKMSKLDQQISEIYRNRTVQTRRNEKQIKQNIEQVLALKDKVFDDISKVKGRTYVSLRQKVANLKRDTIESNKQNESFRSQIFGKLNSLRSRLLMQVGQQEKKRKSYNQIINGLLEKSCEKAQQMLRRKL